jgi:endonuclease-3
MVPRVSKKDAVAAARARTIATRLRRAIPQPRCELNFTSPWQLVVAVILSAQSTDVMVNKVTPVLFARWPTPLALAEADPADVEAVIKSTGFFRNKTKSIQGAARVLLAEFSGEVPRTLDELMQLPGVARKTANVVLGVAFGIASGIVVDTHVLRVSARLGLTKHDDPAKVEQDLCALFPRRQWIDMSHRLLLHGRYVCRAKDPACAACCLFEVCPSRRGETAGRWGARADASAAQFMTAAATP